MKKLISVLLTGVLLAGMTVSALADTDEPASDINENLVVHYDFNGETPEEQLADKAPAGKSKENLTLYSTDDPSTGLPLSYIKDGVAHIDHALLNYLSVKFDAENNIGTDVLDCAGDGEMTVFTAVSVHGAPQAWATFLDFNNVSRMIIKGSKDNKAIFSTLCIRGTTTMNNNANVDFPMKNADIYHDTDTVYIAVTYQYDQTTKKLVGAVRLSFDYGKTYTETNALFENVEEFISQSGHICFGKTFAGNQYKKVDHGSSYDFYDFRVYNKALTADEVKTIRTGHEPKEEETSTAPVTEPETPTAGQPTAEAPTAPENPTTNAPSGGESSTTGTSAPEKNSGCASAVSLGGLSVILTVMLGAGIIKKKKG